MRLTLQRKIFLALALLLAVLLTLFVVASRVSLQRGLGRFVAEIEMTRLDWMVENLGDAYRREGGWEFLRADPGAWHQLQLPRGWRGGPRGPRGGPPRVDREPEEGASPDGRPEGRPLEGRPREDRPPEGRPPERRPPEGRPPGPPPPPPGRERGFPPPPRSPQVDVLPQRYQPPPPPWAHDDPRTSPSSVYNRLALLDADGAQVLAGSTSALASPIRRAVPVDGRTVAVLALAPLPGAETEADRSFVAEQSTWILGVGVTGLLLALGLSGWLGRRWLRPVDQLAGAARAVSQGQLDVHVPVQGDDELARLAQTFNDMAARLAASEQSRQRWLADVAHELRTPIAAMRAEIEAVQDGVRRFEPATAQRLHQQVMRLGKLVDDLRLVLHEPGQAAAAMHPMRPLPVLLEVLETMRPRLAERALRVEGAEALQALDAAAVPTIAGDAERLAQLFMNLLENSVRYTDAGGVVRLGAQVVGARLVLTVDDSAPAPAPEDLPRLFDRFFRGEASRDRARGGSGLGLAICRTIVAQHEGTIEASASPLGGLRMRIELPLAARGTARSAGRAPLRTTPTVPHDA